MAALVTSSSAAITDDPASLAPRDAGLFIRLNELASLRKQWSEDPLGRMIRQQLPFQRQPEAWQAIQKKFGLSGTQILDRYFGRSIAVIGQTTKNGPAVIVSRIEPADAALAVEKLELQTLGSIGRFAAYRTGDDKGYIAFSDRWMVMAQSGESARYAKTLLMRQVESPSLLDDESYKSFAAAHADAAALIFARDSAADEMHFIAGRIEDRALSIDYRGRNADWRKLLGHLGDASACEFGPAPLSGALAAVSLNLTENQVDPKRAAVMDRVLSPRKYEQDVKPMLGAPLVLFAVPCEQGKPPAIGAALRLKDRAAAADLDRLADGLILLLNFKTLELGIDPVARGKSELQGHVYQNADIGAVFAAAQKQPKLADLLKIAYGRIGDWYVVCSQESAYRQCIESGVAPALKIASDSAGQVPIASGMIRPAQAAAVFKAFAAAHRDSSFPPFQEAAGKLIELSAMLEHYSSLQVAFDRQADDFISGRLRLEK